MLNKGNCRGTTLIEVVIIIVLLAIIFGAINYLLPGLGPHTEDRKRTMCFNNLKSIGTGLQLYINDFEVMPPRGPKSLLYADGSGYIPDPEIFECPTVEEKHHPMGDYLRDVNWENKKNNTVIAGDAPENHGYEHFIFLFKDGHAIIHKGSGKLPTETPVNDVEGTANPDDGMYSGTGDTDPGTRTWLKIRD